MSEPTLREAAQALLRERLDIYDSLSRDEFENDAEIIKHGTPAEKSLYAALAASPAAPVAVEPVLWVSPAQLNAMTDPDSHGWPPGGRYLPARKTRAGLFTEGLHTATQLHQAVERARTEEREACAAERNRWEWIVAHWTKADANFHRKGPKEGQLKGLVLTISTEDKGQGGSPHLANVIDDAIRARGTTK